jgi:thiol-disulfide isomerase/thioredoxin
VGSLDPLGLVVLLATLVAATAAGAWRHRSDGRVRPRTRRRRHDAPGRRRDDGAGGAAPSRPEADGLLAVVGAPGERATLVQFSSAFCAPCRTARVVLGDVAERTDGVRHVEIDAEAHLDLVRRLGISRTPTTLVLDAGGNEVGRAGGVPRRDQLTAVLAALGSTRPTS